MMGLDDDTFLTTTWPKNDYFLFIHKLIYYSFMDKSIVPVSRVLF